jgi:hypothetical protein
MLHPTLGDYFLHVQGDAEFLLTENETNPRLFGQPRDGHFKGAFHDAVTGGM